MITREEFNRYLSQALANLFDFVQLQQNPLCVYLAEEDRAAQTSPGRGLQRAVLRGIETLKPDENISPSALQWRTYNLLRMRYVEGRFVKEIMNFLQLGDRQLRRENQRAVAALASILWEEWHVPSQEPQGLSADVFPEAAPRRFSTTATIINLSDAFTNILTTLQSMVGPAWQNIHLALPLNLPPVQSDRVLLRQAFIAAFYRCLSGHPEARATVTAQLRESTVRVAIRGTWNVPPFTLEDSQHLQELFRQVNNTLSMDAGQILLDLPVAESRKILIIDDDEAIVHLFRRYLTGLPYTVVAAFDSKEAVQIAEQVHPDLILLDVLLPDVDGWEILQQLKRNPAIGQTPVIICSGWNDPDIAYSLGANGFLHKNMLQKDLVDAIEEALAPSIQTD